MELEGHFRDLFLWTVIVLISMVKLASGHWGVLLCSGRTPFAVTAACRASVTRMRTFRERRKFRNH